MTVARPIALHSMQMHHTGPGWFRRLRGLIKAGKGWRGELALHSLARPGSNLCQITCKTFSESPLLAELYVTRWVPAQSLLRSVRERGVERSERQSDRVTPCLRQCPYQWLCVCVCIFMWHCVFECNIVPVVTGWITPCACVWVFVGCSHHSHRVGDC